MTIPHITTRIGLLSLGLLPVVPAVAMAVAPVAVAAPAGKLPPAVAQALASGNYNQVQQALTDALKGKKISPESPQVLHAAMLVELIRTTGADTMTAFAASHPTKATFLSTFAQDAEWLELYLSCGLVPYQTEVGLDVLYRIWRAEKATVRNKPLAVALASAWGGGETDSETHGRTRIVSIPCGVTISLRRMPPRGCCTRITRTCAPGSCAL